MILVFNGSPHRNGNTSYIADSVTYGFDEVINIYAYEKDIKPCIDCGKCAEGKNCLYGDMEEIYGYVKKADIVIIASPLYFSAPTGRLMDMFSRFQYLYKGKMPEKDRKGIIIYTGGGTTKTISVPIAIGRIILGSIGIKDIDSIIYTHTDSVPSYKSEYVKTGILETRENMRRFLER